MKVFQISQPSKFCLVVFRKKFVNKFPANISIIWWFLYLFVFFIELSSKSTFNNRFSNLFSKKYDRVTIVWLFINVAVIVFIEMLVQIWFLANNFLDVFYVNLNSTHAQKEDA